MNTSILVTGATGTIGSFILEQLQARGADFIALARTKEKANDLESRGIRSVVGDFANRSSMVSALKGIDRLFLLSVTSPEIPKLQGNVTDAAREAGIGHIVKVSARGASLNSPVGIRRFHAESEEYIRKSGIPFTFLQPEAFMQNLIFDRETIRQQGAIYAQGGDGRVPMIDARDIASAAVASLLDPGHEGKTYVLTGPEAVSYHEIATTLTEKLGKPVKYIPVTSVQSRGSMLEAGMPGWLVEDLVAVSTEQAAGLASEVSPDLMKVTGKRGLTIRDFVQDYLHMFQ